MMAISGGGYFKPVTNWLGQSLGYNATGVWFGNTAVQSAPAPAAPPATAATPVSPTFDPKIEANALYGKPMSLMAGGFARIGASPAPTVGPYINSGLVSFAVSLGLAVPVTGNRKVYVIYLDNELWWSSVTGWDGSGAQPGDAIYHAETAAIEFRPGTLTQAVLSLESEKYPGDENAYRPQMLLQIKNLNYSRFMANTGKPVPYVACDIGDITDGADPADGINIGTGWENIAYSPWAGYSSSTAEAVGTTDLVDAYLLKDNFTIVGLGQADARTHRNIDLLQSDKLRLKDRGSNVTPDFIFDCDAIIGADKPIQITRAGATAQRRELELIAIDPDQDYTAVPSLSKIPRDPFVISAAVGKDTITSPLVLDANTRQALVTFAQQYEENARKKIAFKVRAVGYEVEPGDFVATVDVQDGIDNEVWKVTQTEHLGDFTVALECEAILRCSVYAPAIDPYFGDVVLLLHFNGSNGQTSAIDFSQYAHPIAFIGNARINTAVSLFGGGSLLCDGTGDGVSTSVAFAPEFDFSATNTSPYTIEIWARFNNINRDQVLICRHTGAFGEHFMLRQNGDDELQYLTSSGGSSYGTTLATTAANIGTSQGYPIAVDKDSTGTVRIFVGGVMKAKDTPSDSVIFAGVNTPVTVGIDGLSGRSFDGNIDEVRITAGISRYGDVSGDADYTPDTSPFPDE